MENFKNILMFLYENWITILVCIGLIVGIVRKTIVYVNKTTDEQIKIAKQTISTIILKLCTDAEIDFDDWNKAGEIKRAQVIKAIYEEYPILSKVKNQDELVEWIDNEIKDALKTLREVIKINSEDANVKA